MQSSTLTVFCQNIMKNLINVKNLCSHTFIVVSLNIKKNSEDPLKKSV